MPQDDEQGQPTLDPSAEDQSSTEITQEQDQGEPDYKVLFEEEKRKKEKTAEDYRRMERERNILTDRFAKVATTLKRHGVAEFDDHNNLVIKVAAPNEPRDSRTPQQVIDDKIAALKKQYADETIDSDTYHENLADLKAEKRVIDFKEELQQRQTKETETRSQSEREAEARRILERDFPQNEIADSPLFGEMSRLVTEDGYSMWGDPTTDSLNKNPIDRLRLARAAARILQKTSASGRSMEPRKGDSMHSLESSGGTPPTAPKSKISDNSRSIVYNMGIKDQKINDNLARTIKEIENKPGDMTYFLGNSVTVPMEVVLGG